MKEQTLNQLCHIIGGNPAPKEFLTDTEGVRFIKMKDLGRYHLTNNLTEVDNYVKPNDKYKLIKRNSVLLPRSGSVALNHRAILGQDSYMVSHICALEVQDKKTLYYKFLYYYLTTVDMKKFMKKTTGLDAITFESLGRISIPLPPLSEQKRIAAILDKADNLRQKNKQLLATYDELLQATFLDMFGDPVTNPKGWNMIQINKLCDVQGGLQLSSKRNALPIQAPYLRVANVYRNRLELTEIKKIGLTEKEKDKTLLKKNDILIVEGHGNKNEIGRCALWDGSIGECVHQNHLIRVRISEELITPTYLCYFINSEGGRRQMFKTSNTTSGLNTISTGKVKQMNTLVPPLNQQIQFAQIVENIEAQKAKIKQSLQESEDLFGVLEQKAFKGKLKD